MLHGGMRERHLETGESVPHGGRRVPRGIDGQNRNTTPRMLAAVWRGVVCQVSCVLPGVQRDLVNFVFLNVWSWLYTAGDPHSAAARPESGSAPSKP